MAPLINVKLGIIYIKPPRSVLETGFEFTIKTDNTGTSNDDQFTLPLVSTFNGVTAEVDWGDNNSDTITAYDQSEITHTYSSSGTYTVKITGSLRALKFANGGDKLKILNIINWGVFEFTTDQSFFGCTNITQTATDSPAISTTDINGTFANCSVFNGYIDDWDVSNVQDFRFFLSGASVFNQPLNSWDVSSGTRFTQTFRFSRRFNQPLSNWDVSNALNMDQMFYAATDYNQSLAAWDVSNVASMNQMFRFASDFNQSIDAWDVSSVTNMYAMFRDTVSFNQPLNNWDVSEVTNMADMFRKNDNFNQNISSWNIVKVSSATNFMENCDGFSTANYDALLIGWEATLQSAHSGGSGYTLTPSWHFGNSQYTAGGVAAAARASLISNFGWGITDGGTA